MDGAYKIPPIGSRSIFNIAFGPKHDRITSATVFAATIFAIWALRPVCRSGPASGSRVSDRNGQVPSLMSLTHYKNRSLAGLHFDRSSNEDAKVCNFATFALAIKLGQPQDSLVTFIISKKSSGMQLEMRIIMEAVLNEVKPGPRGWFSLYNKN